MKKIFLMFLTAFSFLGASELNIYSARHYDADFEIIKKLKKKQVLRSIILKLKLQNLLKGFLLKEVIPLLIFSSQLIFQILQKLKI